MCCHFPRPGWGGLRTAALGCSSLWPDKRLPPTRVSVRIGRPTWILYASGVKTGREIDVLESEGRELVVNIGVA